MSKFKTGDILHNATYINDTVIVLEIVKECDNSYFYKILNLTEPRYIGVIENVVAEFIDIDYHKILGD